MLDPHPLQARMHGLQTRPIPSDGPVRILAISILIALVILTMPASYAQTNSERISFDIPSQSVPQALDLFSRQANVVLGFSEPGYENVKTRAVVGSFRPERALEMLLAGTGLRVRIGTGDSVIVHRGTDSTVGTESTVPTANSTKRDSYDTIVAQAGDRLRGTRQGLAPSTAAHLQAGSAMGNVPPAGAPALVDEIIVTGTSIRGVSPESSPLQIYTAIDIRNTGATTVEQFVASLPQNNNTLSEMGTGTSAREVNSTSASTADLRGLGVGSTLVLLNGRRMAPSSGGRAADISFIPIGAIERVEVLTDGASSVYGADAIGGVINFVLKDQQDSAESVLTFGAADGGSEQWRVDQSFGFNWENGYALIAASYMDRNPLDAADREFSRAAAPFTLVPEDTRKNLLATISQEVFGSINVSADILYSTKEPRTANLLTQFTSGADFSVREMEHEQTVVNLAIERSFGEKLNSALLVTFADASVDSDGFDNGPTIGVGPFFESEDTSTLDITAKVDGELFALPSGGLKYAVGAGYTEDEYEQFRDFSASGGSDPSTLTLDRDIRYAFGELLIPIASPEQNINGLRRLELSVSARYTDYSDFGDDTSPKIGVLWSPVEQLKLRGTFGESFRAPFLRQLSGAGFYFLIPIGTFAGGAFPDIWSPDNSTVMLFLNGSGSPTLGPEQAETTTFGFDFDLSGFSVSATYFNIDYTNRIDNPDTSNGNSSLSNPQDFPELFNLNPTLEQITEILGNSTGFNLIGVDTDDPAAVLAAVDVLADNRLRNLAISEMDGLDLSAAYTTEMSVGTLQIGVDVAKIFSFEERIFASAAPIGRIDTVQFPADLKARSYIGLGKDRWNARLNVNYVDDYDNPFDVDNPTIDDWTTVDLLLSYEFPTDTGKFSDGVRLGLTVLNALDEDPPFLPVGTRSDLSILNPVGFDPANANPLGRFVTIQMTKSW